MAISWPNRTRTLRPRETPRCRVVEDQPSNHAAIATTGRLSVASRTPLSRIRGGRRTISMAVLGLLALSITIFPPTCPMPTLDDASAFGQSAWAAFLDCPLHQAAAAIASSGDSQDLGARATF